MSVDGSDVADEASLALKNPNAKAAVNHEEVWLAPTSLCRGENGKAVVGNAFVPLESVLQSMPDKSLAPVIVVRVVWMKAHVSRGPSHAKSWRPIAHPSAFGMNDSVFVATAE